MGNPKFVYPNMYLTVGMTCGILLCWFLPMLAWGGEPISEGLDDVDKIERTVENYGNLIDQALRRNFSPNGVLRNIMIDTVVLAGQVFFWVASAYVGEVVNRNGDRNFKE